MKTIQWNKKEYVKLADIARELGYSRSYMSLARKYTKKEEFEGLTTILSEDLGLGKECPVGTFLVAKSDIDKVKAIFNK